MLLLALDADKGGTTWLSGWTALTGGVLVDAIVAGAVTVEGDALHPGAEQEHPLLRRVREVVAQDEPRTLADWLQRLPVEADPLLEAVAARLIESGVLTEQRGRILGLIPTTRFPEADPTAERELRARLRSVLVDGAEPDQHDLLLIALVQPAGLLAVVTETDERAVRRAARQRAQELAARAGTDSAAEDAVAAVSALSTGAAVAAMMGAVSASTAASTVTATDS
jgi:hypothetical protein